MTEQAFELTFSGKDVSPETMPIGELAELLASMEIMVKATIEESSPGVEADNVVIGLTSVLPGSIRLRFATAAIAVNLAFGLICSSISARQYDNLPAKAIEAITVIDKYAKLKNLDIDLIGLGDSNASTRIPASESISLPQMQVLEGETAIYGYLQRVGGVEPHAWLRTINGESVSVHMSHNLARQIATRLYTTVGLSGRAEWNAKTRQLITFRADNLLPYEEIPIAGALDEVREAIGGNWRTDIDFQSLLRELRGRDDNDEVTEGN